VSTHLALSSTTGQNPQKPQSQNSPNTSASPKQYDTKNTTGAPKPPNTSGSKKQNTPNTSPKLQKPKQLPTPPLAPENSKQQNHIKTKPNGFL
jgi:hypothetical protein